MYKFVYLESYGCSANQNNAEIMKGKIIESGLELTGNPQIADVLIMNTCIVKGPTENKIKERIRELLLLQKPIIVSGCMPEVRKLKQNNIFPLGISHVKDIAKLIKDISQNKYSSKYTIKKKEVKLNCSKLRQSKMVGITQISEGCLGNCNYCITRLAKGSLFSYPEEDIIKSIEKDLKEGCREIWITSQDNAAYGKDSGTTLPELLKKVLKLKGNFKVRVGMMNPNNVLPIIKELIEIYKNEKMYKFLHIPIQSASNDVLKLMNRQYNLKDFKRIISEFKEEIPNITISTDIIAGYPGETKKDHRETLKFIEEIKPDLMNISKFWPMKGTKAAELPQVPVTEARDRAVEIQKLHLKTAEENNKLLENTEQTVFIYEQKGNTAFGRLENYKIVILRTQKAILGRKVKIKIKTAKPHYLLSEFV